MPTVSSSPSLLDLGWDDDWAAALAAASDPDLTPGRVSRIDRGVSTVITATGPVRVSAVATQTIAVGDWVTLAPDPTATGRWALAVILPRRCAFRRAGDGPAARAQVVAANIDTVLLVDAIDGQLSVRHLERYVALAWQSGAVPAIVITKADLASPEQVRRHVAAVAEVARGVAVHVVSAATGQGLQDLAPYLAPGRTVALLGLSGAGKSTLVNLLAGDQILATSTVRADGKGRHTTTYRELVPLPGGGLVIDTPGMRALSVSAAVGGVAQVFADIEDLASRCGFPDCSHTSEPGCAVMAALAAGDLSGTRLASWRQLRNETPAEDPQVARLRIVERKRQKASAKAIRSRSRATQRRLASPPPS
ncbi:MAG: ribosome small subunit-dependent GTPase A [Actinomycetota bacterium]|nr:ribosome small subunit-dependent GTPase A [Actinomycetota bacterium]MDQ6946236.1 ribosome small subunit-dependent GTPase A [Actinomycetota bacterium]